MAEKKKMSVADILAAARKTDAKGDEVAPAAPAPGACRTGWPRPPLSQQLMPVPLSRQLLRQNRPRAAHARAWLT